MCECPPSRGDWINRRAYAGSQIVTTRVQLRELEKTAKRTPPKTLVREWERVRAAKAVLEPTRTRLAQLVSDYADYLQKERETL